MKKITFLKSFKYCGGIYRTGQTAPSKRYPEIPFKDYQLEALKGSGHISIEVTEIPKAPKESTKKETKADS